MTLVPIKFLIDEQINPRVAQALRDKGVDAQSIHDIGLANRGYQDEPLLGLAVSREATLLTLDGDFHRIHAEWQADGKLHCGIFFGETKKYQHTGAIGKLVRFCTDWAQLVGDSDEDLHEFVYNEIHYIQE